MMPFSLPRLPLHYFILFITITYSPFHFISHYSDYHITLLITLLSELAFIDSFHFITPFFIAFSSFHAHHQCLTPVCPASFHEPSACAPFLISPLLCLSKTLFFRYESIATAVCFIACLPARLTHCPCQPSLRISAQSLTHTETHRIVID